MITHKRATKKPVEYYSAWIKDVDDFEPLKVYLACDYVALEAKLDGLADLALHVTWGLDGLDAGEKWQGMDADREALRDALADLGEKP